MQGADAIIHLAAEHKDFGVPEDLYYQVNVDGTEVLLSNASRLDVRKVIFFSSVAVYGNRPEPTTDTMSPKPESPYGKSKLVAEERIHAWVDRDGSRSAVIVRPAVIFGPHNYANMYRLIRLVADGRYTAVGDGTNIKSIGYVENVSAAALYLMDRMKPGVETYNYADTPHLQTRDLVATIAAKLKAPVRSLRIPKALALACALPFDIVAKLTGIDLPLTAKRIDKFTSPTHHTAEKIRSAGFLAPYSLEQGIQMTADWYRSDQNIPPRESA
jgi:nucleoside-diphosphate-sugar epimerase